jgi:hypothetical protein
MFFQYRHMTVPALLLLFGAAAEMRAQEGKVRLLPGAEITVFSAPGSPAPSVGYALSVERSVAERLVVGVTGGIARSGLTYDGAAGVVSVPVTAWHLQLTGSVRLAEAGAWLALYARAGTGIQRVERAGLTVDLGALGARALPAAGETRAAVSAALPLHIAPAGPLRFSIVPGVLAAPWGEAWTTAFTLTGGLGVAIL